MKIKRIEVVNQLAALVSNADLFARTEELVDGWIAENIGFEAVEPILLFIENHANWDFGMPGPLVHFVEKFYGSGYEDLLVESIDRRPTFHTLWMLNRIVNGGKKH